MKRVAFIFLLCGSVHAYAASGSFTYDYSFQPNELQPCMVTGELHIYFHESYFSMHVREKLCDKNYRSLIYSTDFAKNETYVFDMDSNTCDTQALQTESLLTLSSFYVTSEMKKVDLLNCLRVDAENNQDLFEIWATTAMRFSFRAQLGYLSSFPVFNILQSQNLNWLPIEVRTKNKNGEELSRMVFRSYSTKIPELEIFFPSFLTK